MIAARTPGRWGTFLAESNAVYINAVEGEPPREQYVEVVVVSPDQNGKPREADAELIAAAPQMVELLRSVWDAFRGDPNDRALVATIDRIEEFLWKLDGNE